MAYQPKRIANSLELAKVPTPATPPAGLNALYFKADDRLYKKTSGGLESPMDYSNPWSQPSYGGSYNVITFRDVFAWQQGYNQTSASRLCIETNVPFTSDMLSFHVVLTGYSSDGNPVSLDGHAVVYLFTGTPNAIINPTWIANGIPNITVRFARTAGEKLVLIFTSPVTWEYPAVVIDEVLAHYGNPANLAVYPTAFRSGWVVTWKTDAEIVTTYGATVTSVPTANHFVDSAKIAEKAALVHAHAGADITSGTLPDARLPLRLGTLTSANGLTNPNSATVTGFYSVINSTTNGPDGYGYYNLLHVNYNTGYATQIASEWDTTQYVWKRTCTAGVWSAWRRVVDAVDLATKAALAHTHTTADLISGTLDSARLRLSLGNYTYLNPVLDPDSIQATGWYHVNAVTNGPGSASYNLFHQGWDDTYATQIATDWTNNKTWRRSKAGTWSAWVELLHTAGSGASLTGLTKTQVGLSNVDNTTDSAKPVSTAQQTALDLKAPLASPTFTGTVVVPTASGGTSPPTKTQMDTADALLAPSASPTFTGTVVIPAAAGGTSPYQKSEADTLLAAKAATTYVDTQDGLQVPKSLVDAKGDLLVGTADNTVARKAVGLNDRVLESDSTQADGMIWRIPTDNGYFRLAMYGGAVRTAPPYAKIKKVGTQTLVASTATYVTMGNLVEETDATMGDTASDQILIVVAGLYALEANCHFDHLAAGQRRASIVHTPFGGSAVVIVSAANTPGVATTAAIGGGLNLGAPAGFRLGINDTLKLQAWSNGTGVGLNVDDLQGGCYLAARWLSP